MVGLLCGWMECLEGTLASARGMPRGRGFERAVIRGLSRTGVTRWSSGVQRRDNDLRFSVALCASACGQAWRSRGKNSHHRAFQVWGAGTAFAWNESSPQSIPSLRGRHGVRAERIFTTENAENAEEIQLHFFSAFSAFSVVQEGFFLRATESTEGAEKAMNFRRASSVSLCLCGESALACPARFNTAWPARRRVPGRPGYGARQRSLR
jgi:hypothetical protein